MAEIQLDPVEVIALIEGLDDEGVDEIKAWGTVIEIVTARRSPNAKEIELAGMTPDTFAEAVRKLEHSKS